MSKSLGFPFMPKIGLPSTFAGLLVLTVSATPLFAQQPASTPPASSTPAVASGQQSGSQQTTQDPKLAQRPEDDSTPDLTQDQTSDPLHRQLSDKEKFKQQKEVREELKGPYKKWVNEDVRWIITDQELKAFKSLSNDEERDNFIEQFWLRRNPNPDSPENEFREEHYRRIAYANEHFAAGKPGWKTDRGHIYIAYGKPDSIDSHPSGGA
jgi:GWxTD domain-containing protein